MCAFLTFGFSYKGASIFDVWICLPLLIMYPIIVGFAFYGLASELKESKRLLRELSCTDPLTGLLNRRYWVDLVAACVSRRRRIERSVLVVIDVDHFKLINDAYGHAAGDKVLCILSQVLVSKLRAADYICRYGGDEFCVLLTDISISEGEVRMREVCRAFVLGVGAVFPEAGVTLSIGIMPWRDSIYDVNSWVNLADRNLYKAKRNGRNQIVCE